MVSSDKDSEVDFEVNSNKDFTELHVLYMDSD